MPACVPWPFLVLVYQASRRRAFWHCHRQANLLVLLIDASVHVCMQPAMAASTSIAAMHARITYLISQSAAPSGMDGYACTFAILFVR